MRKSRFSDHQILSILKQAEAGTSVPDLWVVQRFLRTFSEAVVPV